MIIVTAIVAGTLAVGVLSYLHPKHHSSVCHRCGGKGYVNGSICPDCCGNGKYHAGKDSHEKHCDFSADDAAIDSEEDDPTGDRQFNA